MQLIGKIIYYICWPIWIVYFRISNRRSRVMIVHGNSVLLVKSIIGSGKWSLPGGGVKRSESYKQAALRELEEETGITLNTSLLKKRTAYNHKSFGFDYHVEIFMTHLDYKPDIARNPYEIADIKWFERDALQTLPVDKYLLDIV